MRLFRLVIFISFPILFILQSCGDIIPVWRQEKTINDYTLYYTDEPKEFQVDLTNEPEAKLDLRLELVVRYYIGIGRNELPLFIIIEDEENNISEFTTSIPLKSGEQWLGVPAENEIDYTITHEAIPSLSLKPTTYSMKIYANDEKAEKIYGVVRLEARMYKLEEIPEP